jgi:hypothetical protein
VIADYHWRHRWRDVAPRRSRLAWTALEHRQELYVVRDLNIGQGSCGLIRAYWSRRRHAPELELDRRVCRAQGPLTVQEILGEEHVQKM